MSNTCNLIKDEIKEHRFTVWRESEDEKRCVIDFKHPKVNVKKPYGYFLSSVSYNKDNGLLNTTVRAKVDNIKELYLDYCCEDGEQMCRPHVHMSEKILSVEASFTNNQVSRFKQLLNEMMFL